MYRPSLKKMTAPPVVALREGAAEQYGDIAETIRRNGTHVLLIPRDTPRLEESKEASIRHGLKIIAMPPFDFGHSHASDRYRHIDHCIQMLRNEDALDKASTKNLLFMLGFDTPRPIPPMRSLRATYGIFEGKLKATKEAPEMEPLWKVVFQVGRYSLAQAMSYEMEFREAAATPSALERHGIGLGRVLEPFHTEEQTRVISAMGFALTKLYDQAQR